MALTDVNAERTNTVDLAKLSNRMMARADWCRELDWLLARNYHQRGWPDDVWGPDGPPYWSTNPSDAIHLAHEFLRDGLVLTYRHGEWRISSYKPIGVDAEWAVCADTLSLALVLAALTVQGVPIPRGVPPRLMAGHESAAGVGT